MEKLYLYSHYSIKNIIRQCLSPILMMLFVSIYGLVDGLFIANFDGDQAFAGVNLVFPIICIVGGAGYMLGSGGSALASKLIGENKRVEADKVFSMMIYFGFLLGVLLVCCILPFVDNLVYSLANLSSTSTPEMIDKAITYGRLLMFSQPLYIVGSLFQNFFVVDEKPQVGFYFTLAAGLTNILFDTLFIAWFRWGVVGAAVATMMGHCVQSIGPILYFYFKKDNLINIVKTRLDLKVIGKCCVNGLSDFIFNISASIVGIVYNVQLLRYIGQNGVAANGIFMYVSFIFISIFIGFVIGIQPIIGFNYGANNTKELKYVTKNCFLILSILSAVMLLLCQSFALPFSRLFANDVAIEKLSVHAVIICSLIFLFAGFSIFITSFFTALNNGIISGIISLFRSLIFNIGMIILIPTLFGEEGIWWAGPICELFSVLLAFFFFVKQKSKYNY